MNGHSVRHGSRVEVRTGPVPACARCGSAGLAAARIANPVVRADGHQVHGTTVVVLCPACDADDPAAGALACFLLVHDLAQAPSGVLAECAALLAAWAGTLSRPVPDLDALDAEVAAWRAGDL